MSNGMHNVIFVSENVVEMFDNIPTLFCGKDSEGSKNLFLQVKGFSKFDGRYKIAFSGLLFPMEETLHKKDNELKFYNMYDFFDKIINRRTLALFSGEGIPLNSVYVLNTGDGFFSGALNEKGVLFKSYDRSSNGCKISKIGRTGGDLSSEVLCLVGTIMDFIKAKMVIREKIDKICDEFFSFKKCNLFRVTGEKLFYGMTLEERLGYVSLVYDNVNEFIITRVDKDNKGRVKGEILKFLIEKFGGM